jgi:hypothetical protein
MTDLTGPDFEREVLNSLDAMDLELALRGGLNAVPTPPEDTDPADAERRLAMNAAADLVKQKDILERICPGLQTVASDAQSLAKWITPGLFPLAIAGTIPMNPLIFAGIAILFLRVGVASLCKECAKSDKDD